MQPSDELSPWDLLIESLKARDILVNNTPNEGEYALLFVLGQLSRCTRFLVSALHCPPQKEEDGSFWRLTEQILNGTAPPSSQDGLNILVSHMEASFEDSRLLELVLDQHYVDWKNKIIHSYYEAKNLFEGLPSRS